MPYPTPGFRPFPANDSRIDLLEALTTKIMDRAYPSMRENVSSADPVAGIRELDQRLTPKVSNRTGGPAPVGIARAGA